MKRTGLHIQPAQIDGDQPRLPVMDTKGTNQKLQQWLRIPSVEIDTQASAVYVRFKKAAVARTVPQESDLMHLAIDLDAKGEVVGIEAVGMDTFNIESIMKQARVEARGLAFPARRRKR